MAISSQDLKFRVLAEVVGAQAIQGLKEKVDGVEKSTRTLAEGMKLLAEVFAVREAVEFGKGILETADRLGKMSQKTGTAVETLAGFAGAAELADVPLEALGKGLNKLSLNIVQAVNGNVELAGTFKNLGINLRDGNGQLKNAGDVTKEVGDKFAQFADGPAKGAIAMKLFGKEGANLIPFLDKGSEEMEKFGLAIDQDFSDRATGFLDTLKVIGFSLKNGAIDNLRELLPTLQEVAEAFKQFSAEKSETVGFMDVLGEVGRLVAQSLVVGFSAAREAIDAVVTGVRISKSLLTGDLKEVGRLSDERDARQAKADAREKAFLEGTTKNSLLFGKGKSIAENRANQFADTVQTQKPSTASLNADAIGENAKILKQFDEKIAKLNAEATATNESNAVKQAAVLIAELESKGISKSSKAYAEYADKITAAVFANETAKEKLAGSDFQRKEEEAIELQRIQIENYDKTTAELQKLVDAKTLDNQATETTKKFTEEGKKAYLENVEAIKAQKSALVDLQEQQKQTWSVGAKQAFKDYLESARNVAQQTKDLFAHAFQNMEDSLVSFVKTGKLDFTKFADDVITDLIRIQVRAALVQAITGAQNLASYIGGAFNGPAKAPANSFAGADDFSGATTLSANGNIMTSNGPVSLKKYANGGIATSPQLSIFGEGSRPEAYVPLPDGRSIPVSMKGGGGDNNVTVHVNMDSSDSAKSDTEKGAQLGKVIAAAVKNELIQQRRPGGVLAG